jgi:hypothetical protein
MVRTRKRGAHSDGEDAVTSADAQFAAAANAAAAAFAATPPYITYRLHVTEQRDTSPRDERFDVAFRASDGSATITPAGRADSSVPPALPPALDALAQWAFSLDDARDPAVMRVTYEHPKRYAFASPGPEADVVVPSIVGYSVRYAEGDVAHLELTPATPDVRAFAAERNHFVYRDVFFDVATSLPRRVILAAPDETLALDYLVVDGWWLLSHVAYAAKHDTLDATYENYAFPAAPAS